MTLHANVGKELFAVDDTDDRSVDELVRALIDVDRRRFRTLITQLYMRGEPDCFANIGPGASTSPADSARAMIEIDGMNDSPATVPVTNVVNPATGHILGSVLRRGKSKNLTSSLRDTCIVDGSRVRFERRIYGQPPKTIFASSDFLQLRRPSTRSDKSYAIVTVDDETTIPRLRSAARAGSGAFANLRVDQDYSDFVTVSTETQDGITTISRTTSYEKTIFATPCVLVDENANRRGRVPERIMSKTEPTPILHWFDSILRALATVFASSAIRDQPVRWTSEYKEK